MEGLNFETEFDSGSFGAARERIANAQGEASARQEMLGTSFQGRVMQMEDQARDLEAESGAGEARGAAWDARPRRARAREPRPSTSVDPRPAPGPGGSDAAARSEAERQLDELEKRLNGQ